MSTVSPGRYLFYFNNNYTLKEPSDQHNQQFYIKTYSCLQIFTFSISLIRCELYLIFISFENLIFF